MTLPIEDRLSYDERYMKNTLAKLMGGRVAEELVFARRTSGASDDIEKATNLARKMVTVFGMSDLMGPIAFGQKEEHIFLGREIAQHRDYSEQTAIQIDGEVRRIVDEAYQTARRILQDHENLLHQIAAALLEKETLEGKDIDAIIDRVNPGLQFTRTVTAHDLVAEERQKASGSLPLMDAQGEPHPVAAKEADRDKRQGGDAQG
jgi:cell division protease FtsH